MNTHSLNMDPSEVAKFEALASRWWDPEGEFKPLHQLNPVRLNYLSERCGGLKDRQVADIGCGGGLLSEAMALQGACVTGIDAGEAPLKVARLHALRHADLALDYRCTTAEDLASEQAGAFDVVTCMELLEHVPEPARLIASCRDLVRPGGQVFFSTLNRTPAAYVTAILGAEYLLRMLPRGTHDYRRFIRPSELANWSREAGLHLIEVQGLSYNPLTQSFHPGRRPDVNYLVHAIRK